mmetsp:Transcript_34998/g.64787  ORF Transcript_34998/g.64787 Transcript_34998/m.64787 type:complete len:246 (+) Transcript_34998:607-1344(+)
MLRRVLPMRFEPLLNDAAVLSQLEVPGCGVAGLLHRASSAAAAPAKCIAAAAGSALILQREKRELDRSGHLGGLGLLPPALQRQPDRGIELRALSCLDVRSLRNSTPAGQTRPSLLRRGTGSKPRAFVCESRSASLAGYRQIALSPRSIDLHCLRFAQRHRGLDLHCLRFAQRHREQRRERLYLEVDAELQCCPRVLPRGAGSRGGLSSRRADSIVILGLARHLSADTPPAIQLAACLLVPLLHP